ncbi:MAG: asparagine synthase (glutamine-hydrolyzing) [Planctomycetes bacterium]|nr:asparagine synthase (glutamine-hydrolyzing) [Planctomycetota bacterium]
MCGIAGILTLRDYRNIRNDLVVMNRAQVHRGPDGEGIYVGPNGSNAPYGVGLAHTRLAVIDPQTGHQPMTNETGSVWLTYNGEIYNYLSLREELSSRNHRFASRADSEVIVHLHEEEGACAVRKLNGMFAYAIWDEEARQMTLARDRFGIKPLYYYFDGKTFAFASEIKALLAAQVCRAAMNPAGIADYLTLQYCLGDKTLYRDIRHLPAASTAVLALRDEMLQLRIERYWEPAYEIDTHLTEEGFCHRLRELLDDAVGINLQSDVPLGAALSGGLDSSVVATLAASRYGGRLKTFTGHFGDDPAYNETRYAREVAESIGAEWFTVEGGHEDFAGVFDHMMYHMDEPAAGPGLYSQFIISRFAKERVTVLLGGQGGDELFGGYVRFVLAYLEECLRGAIFGTQGKGQFVVALESIIPNLDQVRGYVTLLKNFFTQGIFSGSERRYFDLIDRMEGVERFITPEFLGQMDTARVYEEFVEEFTHPRIDSLFNRMTRFEMKNPLRALLQVEDRMSMSVSLESRVPLLDHRIAELFATIPPVMKFKGGKLKYLFLRAVENLIPRTILERTHKMGFPVPMVEWLQGPLRGFACEMLLGERTRRRGIFDCAQIERTLPKEGKFGRRLWGLLCLEMWCRIFLDGDGPHTGLSAGSGVGCEIGREPPAQQVS